MELREILFSIETGFSLVNAAVVCAVLESNSALEPSSVITEPRYLQIVARALITSSPPAWTISAGMMSTPADLPFVSDYTAASRALIRLKPVWNDRSMSLSSKIQKMRSLVTSIFLYACESWTLTAELQRRIQAVEMRCYRKILRISYKDHVTNEEVRAKIQQAIGPHEDIPTIVQRRIPQCYGHVSRSSDRARTILQGTVEAERRRHQGMDRPGVHQVPEGSGEQGKMEETGCEIIVVPKRPSRLRDR